jgi:tetratricopeptide (TPR) repeat protein
MGYWTYYLALVALTYALHQPLLMLGAIGFFVLRPFIPDPFVLARTWSRIRALDAQIAANPANVTARRDLAEIWLTRLRPRRALTLLDEARARTSAEGSAQNAQNATANAELLYLTGVARVRCGDAEGALEPLVQAVDLDPRVRFGEPYLVAAEALTVLGRFEEAEDALDRYVHSNSSSLQGYVRLAEVRKARGDREGARRALREALDTWAQLPGYRRRKELGWWLRAWVARLST